LLKQNNHLILSSNLSVLGPAGFSDVVYFTNNVVIQGDLGILGYPNVGDTLDSIANKVANITGLATNLSAFGSLTNNGTGRFVGALTILDDVTGTSGKFWTLPNIVLLSGNTIEFPSDTTPTTTARQLSIDADLYGGGRGGLQFNDGVSDTIIVNVLKSDTPSNGQVPKFNTGGTITWEDDGGGSGTPAGNNFEVQYNDGGVFAASTNILVSTNKSVPQVIVGTPAMSSTVGGFEVRGITHTNRVTQHGVSALDNTLALGISNFAYQVTFEIEDGRLNLAASVGGGLGSTIKDNWSFIQATNLYADSSIHTPGTITSAQYETTNATPGSSTAAITTRSAERGICPIYVNFKSGICRPAIISQRNVIPRVEQYSVHICQC